WRGVTVASQTSGFCLDSCRQGREHSAARGLAALPHRRTARLVGAQREHCAEVPAPKPSAAGPLPLGGLTFLLGSTSTKLDSRKRERATAQLLRKTVRTSRAH